MSSTMLLSKDRDHGLIRFTGLNFRSERVQCQHCGWHGSAGELRVPGLQGLNDTVAYDCPRCNQKIAIHSGLSTREVMSEMQHIRSIFADEMVQLQKAMRAAATRLDTVKVRTQLPAVRVHSKAGSKPLNLSSVASGCDLNFHEVRARISGIA